MLVWRMKWKWETPEVGKPEETVAITQCRDYLGHIGRVRTRGQNLSQRQISEVYLEELNI